MSLAQKIESHESKMRAWENDNPKRYRRSYFKDYTLCFLIVALLTFIAYPLSGREIIWEIDGLEQFYPYFIYTGRWIREVVGSLFSGQGLIIPQWSYEMGYGSNILGVVDTLYDPLNWLSALCPEQYSEYMFQLVIILRLYLAGVTFSLFALHFKLPRYSVLIAALVYSLGGTALGICKWGAGAQPLVLFPLLLLGVEKMLTERKPALFIISTALFFFITYYFSYMACIFLIPYCAARVILTQKDITVRKFIGWVLKFVGALAVGVLISCISLVPQVIYLLGSNRATSGATVMTLFYSFDKVFSIISGFVSVSVVGSDCNIGFGGIGLFACALLFAKKGENRLLKAALVASTLMLFIPICGSVLNGFGYATNRWVFAYAMLVCFIIAKMLPELMNMDARARRMLFIWLAVYAVIVLAYNGTRTEKNVAALAAAVVLLVALVVPYSSRTAQKAALSCCVVLGLAVNGFYYISSSESGMGSVSLPIGAAYDRLTDTSPDNLVAQLDDTSTTWRYDANATALSRLRNNSVALGLRGIDYYYSIYNSYVDEYHTELGLSGKQNWMNFSYSDLNGRAALDTLSGVKYLLTPAGKGDTSEYNYNDSDNVVATGVAEDINWKVYRAEKSLPMAYTYDSYISRETYDSLTPLQRQEALLQGVVLEDADDTDVPEASLSFESQNVSYTVSAASGCEVMDDGTIRVTSKNATLTLSFEGLPNSETYVYFNGLDYEGHSKLDMMSQEDFDNLAWYSRAKLLVSDMSYTEPDDYYILFKSDGQTGLRKFSNVNKHYHLYSGKTQWLVNLGYSEEAQHTVTLTFSTTGDYHLDSLEVLCQPMDSFDEQIDALSDDAVQGLEFKTNEIVGSVDYTKDEVLYFSLPYDEGWSATVDGEPAELERANTGFTALKLSAGHHDIKLTYTSPGVATGAWLSLAGIVAFVVIILATRKRAKR